MSRLNLAILAALAQADAPLHASGLRPEVEARLGARLNRGALARALVDLSEAHLLLERPGAPDAHGGPPRLLYAISSSGRERLTNEVRAFVTLTRLRGLSSVALAFLQNPPPGSKVAKAKDYGVDLTRLSRALVQSPQERYREAVRAMNAFRKYAR